MNANIKQQCSEPGARNDQYTRKAKVAPLLSAGLSLRAISAQTGIPVGAMHRAKRQLEKLAHSNGEAAKAKALRFERPCSYIVKQNIKGVPHDVRRLTVAVYERAVDSAIRRRLLGRGDLENPWTVVSVLFAGMFDDHTSSGSTGADI
jgi:hypothetical protein